MRSLLTTKLHPIGFGFRFEQKSSLLRFDKALPWRPPVGGPTRRRHVVANSKRHWRPCRIVPGRTSAPTSWRSLPSRRATRRYRSRSCRRPPISATRCAPIARNWPRNSNSPSAVRNQNTMFASPLQLVQHVAAIVLSRQSLLGPARHVASLILCHRAEIERLVGEDLMVHQRVGAPVIQGAQRTHVRWRVRTCLEATSPAPL